MVVLDTQPTYIRLKMMAGYQYLPAIFLFRQLFVYLLTAKYILYALQINIA